MPIYHNNSFKLISNKVNMAKSKNYEQTRAYDVASKVVTAVGGLAAITLATIGVRNLINIEDPAVVQSCMEMYKSTTIPTYGYLAIGSAVTTISALSTILKPKRTR